MSYGLILWWIVLILFKEMVQLLYIIASLHVLLCPFTKVEESFNIQATHDILYHRHNLSQYDHNEFPGVVPRTFIGPLVISAFSAPVVTLFHLTGINKFWMQYVVRLVLALSVIASWVRVRNALQNQFGVTYAWWYTIITVTQYHFMFYMSRPLPNIMVLPLVFLAFEGWLSGKHKQFLVTAGASIIIFRAELAMLFGLFLIIDLYFKKIDLISLFRIVIPAGVGLVALTVIVDSIFWGRLLWPEAEVFWYNTIMNKSSNWGTSPFLWYFYSALPRGLGPSIVLIPVGLYLERRVIQYAAPAFVYILLYSYLPHKELRFIIYVFPLLNMASAAACTYVYVRRTKAPVYELLFWGSVIVILGNIVMSLAFVLVAMTNYPGGVAITRFHKILRNEPFINVHICNLAAQTGVTRYTEINDRWMYSKNESLPFEQLQDYTHLLFEAKSKYSPNLKYFAQTHVILDSIESFSQIAMNYRLIPPVKIKTKPALFILERKDFREYPFGHNNMRFLENSQTDFGKLSINDESVLNVINYDNFQEKGSQEFESGMDIKDQLEISTSEDNIIIDINAPASEESIKIKDNDEISEVINSSNEEIKEPIIQEEIVREEEKDSKFPKAKKALDDLKILRQERKKKAIEKIKTETRREVVESAKEKLKEIMKRHKHIADELSETIISDITDEIEEKDGRGDIPDTVIITEQQKGLVENNESKFTEKENPKESEQIEIEQIENNDVPNVTNDKIDSIVEEVIVRLIDRKIYDDKTKPEDIKPEDRLMIQKIVEEVVAEKMNYSNSVYK